MDSKLLLAKCCTLLYRESQLVNKTDDSSDLVRTVLEKVQVSDIGIGVNSDRDTIMALKTTILELCTNPTDSSFDKTDLLQRLRINCNHDDRLYEAIRQGMDEDMTEGSLKKSTVSIRRSIHNHFKEQTVNDILNKATLQFKYSRDKIKDVNQFLSDLIGQLEPLQLTNSSKDPGVSEDLDIGNTEALNTVFTNVLKMNKGERVYKTGWPALNRMLQGGFRPGEEWVFNGLQHKYKTGFDLSVLAQIAVFNKPMTIDPTKKPLILHVTCEDPLVNNLQFLYQFLKYSETRVDVKVSDVPVEEMTEYVKSTLGKNGWNIRMLKVDPNQWTYKSICNKIVELEAEGYSIEVLNIDYLYKIPTTGCATGVIGNDIMDMYSRVRSFCSAKGILFTTPHQLSTEAKNLLRNYVGNEENFVKEIAGKGYFEGTKGLDRIYDGGLIIHLFKHNKETYLAIQLDKHRYPLIVEDSARYFIMKFPKGMPIPYCKEDEDNSFVRLKDFQPSNADADLFEMG